MTKQTRLGAFILAAAACFAPEASAQACTLADADFKLVNLVTRNGTNAIDEPLKMALDVDGAGNVDIYFVERKGKVRKFVGATKEVQTLATIPNVNSEFEGGVAGIALDPGFKSNKWIYVYYGTGTGSAFRFRVSRFTYNGATIDLASEKIVMAIQAEAAKLHTGGAMAFDKDGNLLITVGDNAAGEVGPGNTNDHRGKILRIKPTPEGTYTIPAGNLYPPGTAQTKPEIYIMGTRNAYTMTLDPVRGLVTWGDIGPDQGLNTEEHNSAAKAGNYGYPFYAGDNIQLIGGGSAAAPVNNNAGNTGLKNLPPAIPATNAYKQSASITGPIFRLDGIPANNLRMPAPFEGLWMVADFSTGFMDSIRLDAAGTRKVAMGRIFRNIRLDRPLDIQQGPDGAIYVLQYSGWFSSTATTGFARIEYKGTCPVSVAGAPKAPTGGNLVARGFQVEVADAGEHALELADLRGRVVARFQGRGEARYDLSDAVGGRSGLYTARLVTAGGSLSKAVVLGR